MKLTSPDAAFDDSFEPLFAECRAFTMTTPERLYAVYRAVEYVVKRDIAGDIAECGVWRGGSSMMGAHALRQFGDTKRHLYLYDTYSGMSQPTAADGVEAIEKWRRLEREDHNEWCYASLDDVAANLRNTGIEMERVHLVQGKVEETIPSAAPEQISLLRLDTDWFESTYHELVHLYCRLSTGGVLIVDDYGHWGGARAAVDSYFGEDAQPILFNRIDVSGYIGVKS